MDKKPWDVNHEFTEERLLFIAGILKQVRNRTVDLHDTSEGDAVWSLGCRVYERSINIIARETEKIPWLRVIKKGLYFVMLIEGVPIRFYRGEIENPTTRSLQRLYPEIEAQQCIFPFAKDQFEWFWRIVVETDESGKVFRVVIAQFAESGNVRHQWTIPISESFATITSIIKQSSEGVVLEKPIVEPRQDMQKKAAGNDKV